MATQTDQALRAQQLNQDCAGLVAAERLVRITTTLPDARLVLTTSFGLEDQAITAMIAEQRLPIELVTLDTGRMFPETYQVWRETEAATGLKIRAFYPDGAALEQLISAQGIDGFYDGIEKRNACCNIRKVVPLTRALTGAAAWITGLRAGQSQARAEIEFASFDAQRRLIKLNPIADWSRDDTVAFSQKSGIPTHPLHAKNFPSIGCAPCTREVEPGEDERAGRWWWELSDKECGLHVGPDGRLVRTKAGQPA